MYLICTSHTTILSMRYRRVNQIIVLANLANYNKRKQFNEPIKIGNVDTVFLNSEMKSAGKKAAAASFRFASYRLRNYPGPRERCKSF